MRRKLQASGNNLNVMHFLSKDEQPAHHRSRSMIVRKYGTDPVSEAPVPQNAVNHTPRLDPGQNPNTANNPTTTNNQSVVMMNNDNRPDVPHISGAKPTMKFLNPSSAAANVDQMFAPNVDAFSRSPRNSIRRNRGASMRGGGDEHMPEGMDDHFDQYCFDGDLIQQAHPMRLFSEQTSLTKSPKRSGYSADWTPDSGVSESMDNVSDMFPATNRSGGNRRSTLPNLSPEDIINMVTKGCNQTVHCNEADQEVVMRKRNQNQVCASPPALTPQRTASLYTGSAAKVEAKANAAKRKVSTSSNKPKRKKSLPDIGILAATTDKVMSRAEVSTLSSQRREEMRRQLEEADRLRSNPLLYLLSPDVQVSLPCFSFFHVCTHFSSPLLLNPIDDPPPPSS